MHPVGRKIFNLSNLARCSPTSLRALYDEHEFAAPKRWHRCTSQLPVWLISGQRALCCEFLLRDPTSTFAAFLSAPVMEIFWPCPSNFRHVDFPCFRAASGSDLIWSESTTLESPAYGSTQKSFPSAPRNAGPRFSDHADHTRRRPELHNLVSKKISSCRVGGGLLAHEFRQLCSARVTTTRRSALRPPSNATRSRKGLTQWDKVTRTCRSFWDIKL